MRLSKEYVWEKLMAGVSSIAEHDLSIKERLANAYMSQIVRLEEEGDLQLEIPEAQAVRLREVLARLKSVYIPSECTRIGDFSFDAEEAGTIIRELCSIYDAVCRLMPAR